MKTKAQLTAFFIFIIVILLISFLVSFISKKPLVEQTIETNQIDPVQSYVESCLKQTAIEGVYLVSLQGGYNDLSEVQSIPYFLVEIPLFWNIDKNWMTNPEVFEEELSYYIAENIGTCFNEFETLKTQGYTIEPIWEEYSEATWPIASITEDRIRLQFDFPFRITNEGSQIHVIESFSSSIPFDMGKIYGYVDGIIEEQQNDPNSLPIGYLSSLAFRNGFRYETIEYDPDTTIISLIFDQPQGDDLIFSFAHRYDWKSGGDSS